MQPCHVLLHRTGWSTQAGGGPAPRAAVPGKEAQTQRVTARDMKPGLRARWHRPGILALRRPGQEGCKLHICLVHSVSSAPARPCFKERKGEQNNPLSFHSLTRFIQYHTRKTESTEALEKRWIWNGERVQGIKCCCTLMRTRVQSLGKAGIMGTFVVPAMREQSQVDS